MFLHDDVLKYLCAMQLVSSAFAVLALISFVQMHRVHNSANFSGGRQIRGPMAGVCCGAVCCGTVTCNTKSRKPHDDIS